MAFASISLAFAAAIKMAVIAGPRKRNCHLCSYIARSFQDAAGERQPETASSEYLLLLTESMVSCADLIRAFSFSMMHGSGQTRQRRFNALLP